MFRHAVCLLTALIAAVAMSDAGVSRAQQPDVTTDAERLDTGSGHGNRLWVQTDYLHWWTKGNHLPALLTTSSPGTDRADAGVLGRTDTSTLLGNGRIDDRARSGGRLAIGYWLDDDHQTGLETIWFTLGDPERPASFSLASQGDPILARPFFNLQGSRQDSELVAFPGVVDGRFGGSTSSELHSVSVLMRRNWHRGCGSRIDLLAGYRFFHFRENLLLTENLVSQDPSGPIQVGTRIDLFDRFATKNDFHGGEIGAIATLQRQRWSLEVLGKVALGNDQQTLQTGGLTHVTTPGDPTATQLGGLLALPSNIGRHTDNDFAALPELGVDFRLAATETLDWTVGYTLVYLSQVLRTGDQIDPTVNASQMSGGALNGSARPAAPLRDDSLWAQGIHCGLIWRR
jgi:hypothetical protein